MVLKVRQENPDVICFQEVRSGSQPELENQILDLKALLPSKYKWHIFRVANNVSLVINSIHTEWNREGNVGFQILIMTFHLPNLDIKNIFLKNLSFCEISIFFRCFQYVLDPFFDICSCSSILRGSRWGIMISE